MARKIKSIMQDKEAGQCYLCCLLHKDYSIKTVRQEHHVIGGTANRKLSENMASRCGSTRTITSTDRRRYIKMRKSRKCSIRKHRKLL